MCTARSRFWARSIGSETVSDEQAPNPAGKAQATVIKKYANRRLYNTATSTYVTLDDLALMVKNGQDFLVYDAKSGEDITRSVLTQIIFEEENKGGAQNLLPVNFLRNLIRFYGDQMQGLVPGYLDFSLDNLMKEQEKIRKQMMDAIGVGDQFKGMEDQAKRNMAMFNDAMKMFNPFATMMGGGMPGAGPKPGASGAASPSPAAAKDDLQALKDQLAAMQQKLDNISR
ncbi:MAG: polyhydroxyalkanoate synthesis repressor PhaR [Alphaproteobacteria bacterium]|nr:polyhydroxyalkanoate synthesis repressor PhaR [Alphaproteobacteria bacterium]